MQQKAMRQRFTWESSASQYEKVYRRAIEIKKAL
jgi:glycogen synthase